VKYTASDTMFIIVDCGFKLSANYFCFVVNSDAILYWQVLIIQQIIGATPPSTRG